MTTKLILIDTDTHVVVPRKTDLKQLENCGPIEGYDCDRTTADKDHSVWYEAMLQEAPQLTTPPVLRWEGEWLILGDEKIAVSTDDHCGCFWVTLLQNDIGGRCESMEAGRRAAEKALGLPIVEEV